MDEAMRKWKEKIAKAEARLAESAEDLEAAEERVDSADEMCKKLKKELEAARVSRMEDVNASSWRESQNSLKEEELKLLLDKQAKEIEAMNKQLNQLKANQDANVQAGNPSTNLKEQLQDLKAHHTTAVDLFKGEIDSLRNKLEGAASQTRNLEAEIGRVRKELEEKVREQKDLNDKHNELHNSYHDLQKELAVNRQEEAQMLPQGLDLARGGSGSSSSYPTPSPLLSLGLSRDDAIRINQGKLEAENSQLQARCQELVLQHDSMRGAIGIMRSEMESLQRQTKSPPRSPSLSHSEKHEGVKHLNAEVNNLKLLVQDMANELGELRAGSPNVHCQRPPQRQSTLPKRSGVSPKCRPKSSAKIQSSSHSQSPRSPPHTMTLRIVQSGAREYAHNPYFGYSTVPPSMTAQYQQEFEPDTIPINAKLMAGMTSSHNVAHASRAQTVSPSKSMFRSNAKTMNSSLKPWGFDVGHGETGERHEVMGLVMEGKSCLHERPQAVDNDPLHKGTSSQRARFKSGMKRKEELNRPKARNWNIKDDRPFEA